MRSQQLSAFVAAMAERSSPPSSPDADADAPSSSHSRPPLAADGLPYHRGFGNAFESESYPGSLPVGRNNPRLVPCGLYAEQLSGTAFTAPRSENRRTWLYRVRPSAAGTSSGFRPCGGEDGKEDTEGDAEDDASGLPQTFGCADWESDLRLDPDPMRWGPMPPPPKAEDNGKKVTFLRGMRTMLGSGDPTCKAGVAIYVYAFDANMSDDDESGASDGALDTHMYNSDGDFLIVPQQRTLAIQTEMGKMTAAPGEICVVPRGIVFTVNLLANDGGEGGGCARGYVLEIFRGHFALPELGPIGSNGLANARDFLHPAAHRVSDPSVAERACLIVNKFGQRLFVRRKSGTPYDVVAWHGNYLPFKYDLRRFCAINSVTYDHPDPSIYTVLTARGGDEEGTALADFVIFPPRVMATDANTFRPPWFHRNVMTEFMGLIYGEYDAKKRESGESSSEEGGGGFVPGGASLHSIMTPHGPDAESYHAAVRNPCKEPTKFEGGLAFMFETSAMCRVSRYARECGQRERGYARCWDRLRGTFPNPQV
ncbi:hypothetical protein ACHAWF_004221 [Thalassiosira exigua]